MWIINFELSEQFKDIIKRKFMCYLDSNEVDLISLNSKFIDGSLPTFEGTNEIFVYAIVGKRLNDFINEYFEDPLLLFIHVPKEKKNHSNIKTIIIQIYTFLSWICDVRIVVLNKSFYEIQVQNMLNVFNIVDKNIKKMVITMTMMIKIQKRSD